MSNADVFNSIYKNNAWGNGSGPGSRADKTIQYQEFLKNFFLMNNVSSVVDLGCGDWQFSRYIDWTGIDYLGLDVSSVVLEITKEFSVPGIRFQELDGSCNNLPPADVLLIKDVLQHLSNKDISNIISKLNNFKYALITNGFQANQKTHLINNANKDINSGSGARTVDLLREPFNLKGCYVFLFPSAKPEENDKRVFLWSR